MQERMKITKYFRKVLCAVEKRQRQMEQRYRINTVYARRINVQRASMYGA